MILIVMALACAAVPAASEPVARLYVGANAIWFDETARPSDLELGGTARASLSPHISLVGSGFFGLENSYARGTAGVRITATDAQRSDFSVGFGAEYQLSSEPSIRPEEWVATTSVGWVPWPDDFPGLIIGGQGGYGLSSNTAYALIAVRHRIGGGL